MEGAEENAVDSEPVCGGALSCWDAASLRLKEWGLFEHDQMVMVGKPGGWPVQVGGPGPCGIGSSLMKAVFPLGRVGVCCGNGGLEGTVEKSAGGMGHGERLAKFI